MTLSGFIKQATDVMLVDFYFEVLELLGIFSIFYSMSNDLIPCRHLTTIQKQQKEYCVQ